MDVTQPLTAEQVLADYSFADLARIFRTYGEERFSKQIARAIVRRREIEPLTTSGQLNRLVDEVVPQAHPSCRKSCQTSVPSAAYRSQW